MLAIDAKMCERHKSTVGRALLSPKTHLVSSLNRSDVLHASSTSGLRLESFVTCQSMTPGLVERLNSHRYTDF